MEKLEFETIERPELESCKGLIFRGYSCVFEMNGKIERKEGIRLLKRESCPGCKDCGYLMDEIREAVCSHTLILPDIEHGALYSVRLINLSKDWETGIVDSYDIEIYKLKG